MIFLWFHSAIKQRTLWFVIRGHAVLVLKFIVLNLVLNFGHINNYTYWLVFSVLFINIIINGNFYKRKHYLNVFLLI